MLGNFTNAWQVVFGVAFTLKRYEARSPATM
jgi:hypothetical protein